jgi:phytoene/squalene synthetase
MRSNFFHLWGNGSYHFCYFGRELLEQTQHSGRVFLPRNEQDLAGAPRGDAEGVGDHARGRRYVQDDGQRARRRENAILRGAGLSGKACKERANSTFIPSFGYSK